MTLRNDTAKGGIAERPQSSSILITTDLLIPGRGQPQKNMAVILKDSKISKIKPIDELGVEISTADKKTHVPVLLPGLWDCHIHYIGVSAFPLDKIVFTPQALSGARIALDAYKTLMSGFTSGRELLGYGVELSQAIEEGTVIGPNIYSAVCGLSQTAGHGEAHSLPLQTVKDFCNHGGPLKICDGVDECRKAVREMIRRGAKVIKVMATGGVLTQIDDPQDAQFSPEELKVIVEEATKAGRVVAAHCHGKAGIMAALKAGVRTIEHGTFLDAECINLMKVYGAMLVATDTIMRDGIKHPEMMDPVNFEKMEMTLKHHDGAYKLAVKSGVKIALGTDLGITKAGLTQSDLCHGNGGQELYWACNAGMTPLEAIECATANGPLTLGERFAPLSGQIREGFDADLIALDENPLDDIKLFSNPDNIKYVWKGGKLYKEPSKIVDDGGSSS